jgi:hypothetical protein
MPSPDVARIVDPLVQNMILGYMGPDDLVATRLLPVLTVPKRADTIAAFGKELKRQHDTIVTGLQSKPVRDFTLGHRDVTTRDRYSAYWLTDMVLEEWDSPIDPAVLAARLAYDDIWRDIEVEAAALIMAAGNWAAAHQQAAGAAWANVAFDIPAQIDTQCTVVENAIGVSRKELTLFLGNPVWPWVRRNTAVRQAASIAIGRREVVASPIGYVTEEVVALCLDVKQVIVGRAQIATDIAAVTFANIWDDDAALLYIPENMATTQPLAMPFGALIRRAGHPKPFAPYRDYTKIGNPYMYEVEDCIRANMFETVVGGGTSEAGYVWFNAV